MSSPAAVAQRALDDAQTAALVGSRIETMEILLSALHHIASGGVREPERWTGLRKDPEFYCIRKSPRPVQRIAT